MVHAISAALNRLAQRARARQVTGEQVAACHGWQVRQVAPGTYRFRDPRFDRLQPHASRPPAAIGGGRDG